MSEEVANFLKKNIKKILHKCGYTICKKNYFDDLNTQNMQNNSDTVFIEIEEKIEQNIPPILIIAMPKSAGKYIRIVLKQKLCLHDVIVDNSQFPYSMFETTHLRNFCQGNTVAHTHINASTINCLSICKATPQIVFNIRDPRNSLISFIHHFNWSNEHIDENKDHIHFFSQSLPYLGEHFTSKSFDEKFNLCFKYYYKELIIWMTEWFDILNIDFSKQRSDVYFLNTKHIVANNEKFSAIEDITTKVLLTTQEDLVQDGEYIFFKKIFNFYSISDDIITSNSVEKNMEVHFRSGRIDSWKTEISPEQQLQLNALLPSEWFSFFGWEK